MGKRKISEINHKAKTKAVLGIYKTSMIKSSITDV